jgi:glycerate dehydrogenase
MKIVFLERNTFRVEFRRPRFPHMWVEFGETSSETVVSRLVDADIAIVNKLPLTAAELSLLPRLSLIAVAATGVDNIDLGYCRAHSIAVCNVRNYAGRSLPEHVFMLILALRRSLIAYREDVLAGKWQDAKQFCLLEAPINDINGSTLGIVGYGFLGKAIAKLARAIEMDVVIAERKNATHVREGRIAFNDVLAMSDVVTLHCPLNPETANLISAGELELMKSNALLINTSRGGLINELDLLRALREGWIAGAALDVLRQEPPRDENPLLSVELPNLLITPHIAWASSEAMRTLADQLIDNIESFVRGDIANRVV